MSSLFTASEIALARLGLAELSGADLDVVVGGLGLGYTAKAVLEHEAVKSLVIVEALDAVIDWHERGVLPLGPALTADPRSRFVFLRWLPQRRVLIRVHPLDGLMPSSSTSTIHRTSFSIRRTRPFMSPRAYRGSPHTFFPAASSGFGLTRFRTRRSHSGLPRSSPWRAPSGWRFTIRFRTGSSSRPFTSRGQKLRQNCMGPNDDRQSVATLSGLATSSRPLYPHRLPRKWACDERNRCKGPPPAK